MNCREFIENLDEVVLCRGELPSALQQHAQQCAEAECQNAWADFQLLERAVAAWQVHDQLLLEAVPPIRQHVSTGAATPRVASQPVPAKHNQHKAPGGWVAVALAGVAVCSLVAVRFGSFSTAPLPGTSESVAGRRLPGVPTAVASTAPADSLPAATDDALVVRELSETYVGWIQNSTGRITDTVAYVLIQEPAEERVVHPPLWWERLGENLEPLGEGLQRSFRDLLNTTPVDMGNAS